ncbi:MAG: hypothetical protein A3C55_05960 [Gammaproteobacteria bacterium RIFCSPHIGHO2_02_FULL_42_13]|nr:MAG: hypothetical protein A3C55_05960 [Gammaproteobacteria bacterium RIFCSPHIGHO2_02_FULL_42_13]OGT70742.1 MAG: hypothetical protein A3H43_05020 [Gammaproteobacteria bacterium RIFCSPLOWO2_02_FULL_42_9]
MMRVIYRQTREDIQREQTSATVITRAVRNFLMRRNTKVRIRAAQEERRRAGAGEQQNPVFDLTTAQILDRCRWVEWRREHRDLADLPREHQLTIAAEEALTPGVINLTNQLPEISFNDLLGYADQYPDALQAFATNALPALQIFFEAADITTQLLEELLELGGDGLNTLAGELEDLRERNDLFEDVDNVTDFVRGYRETLEEYDAQPYDAIFGEEINFVFRTLHRLNRSDERSSEEDSSPYNDDKSDAEDARSVHSAST